MRVLCCRIQSTFTFPNTLILLCFLLLSLFSLRAISHHHHQSVVMNTHAEKGRQTQREGEEEGRRNQAEEKASSFTFITSNNNNDVPPLFVQYEVYPKCAEEQIERNVKLFQKEPTTCPDEKWYDEWTQEIIIGKNENEDDTNSFVAIEVGCNKGTDAILQLRRFTKDARASQRFKS